MGPSRHPRLLDSAAIAELRLARRRRALAFGASTPAASPTRAFMWPEDSHGAPRILRSGCRLPKSSRKLHKAGTATVILQHVSSEWSDGCGTDSKWPLPH